MMDSLADTTVAFYNLLRLVPGLRRVWEKPPESMSEFPCAIIYPYQGELWSNAAGGRSFHTVRIEIHHTRQVMPQALGEAEVWPGRLYEVLRTASLDIQWPVRYRCGPIDYSNERHYGVQFDILVKVNEES